MAPYKITGFIVLDILLKKTIKFRWHQTSLHSQLNDYKKVMQQIFSYFHYEIGRVSLHIKNNLN
jgi:hypothetical protein